MPERQQRLFLGKQRLALMVLVVAALVGGFALVSARRAEKPARPTGTDAATNANGGTTASVQEVEHLKSYGLVATELPLGIHLVVAEEFRNYAVAAGDKEREKELANKGRVDGYLQQWEQRTAQLNIAVSSALYDSPAHAMAALPPVSSDAVYEIKPLPDPSLGNFSRMYAFTTSAPAGPKLQGWVVQWVRGRTLLEVNGVGPTDELHDSDILNSARTVDGRAAKNPIK